MSARPLDALMSDSCVLKGLKLVFIQIHTICSVRTAASSAELCTDCSDRRRLNSHHKSRYKHFVLMWQHLQINTQMFWLKRCLDNLSALIIIPRFIWWVYNISSNMFKKSIIYHMLGRKYYDLHLTWEYFFQIWSALLLPTTTDTTIIIIKQLITS